MTRCHGWHTLHWNASAANVLQRWMPSAPSGGGEWRNSPRVRRRLQVQKQQRRHQHQHQSQRQVVVQQPQEQTQQMQQMERQAQKQMRQMERMERMLELLNKDSLRDKAATALKERRRLRSGDEGHGRLARAAACFR